MVSAPVSYIGLVIALLLVVTIVGSVWVLVNKLVRLPELQVEKQRALPAKVENMADNLEDNLPENNRIS